MKPKQLTLIDVPPSSPVSDWLKDDPSNCEHQWMKASNKYGLVYYRCYKCKESREPDPGIDRQVMLAWGRKLTDQFLDYFEQAQKALHQNDFERLFNAARIRFWQAKLQFAVCGEKSWGNDWLKKLDLPCPPELLELRDRLFNDSTPDLTEEESPSESDQSAETIARGKNTPSKESDRSVTPSKKSRRKKGDGSGWLLNKPVTRNGKTYDQWWFQYEVGKGENKRVNRSVYVPKLKLSQVTELNDQRVPIDDILKCIASKR